MAYSKTRNRSVNKTMGSRNMRMGLVNTTTISCMTWIRSACGWLLVKIFSVLDMSALFNRMRITGS